MELGELLAKLGKLADQLGGLIIWGPIAFSMIGGFALQVHKWAKGLAEARQKSWWEAARYLWSVGQGLKATLDANGKSRADLIPQLKDHAPNVLWRFGLAAGSDADVQKLVELARMIHKSEKGAAPKLIPGEVLTLPDPPEGPGASPAPGPSSPGSEPSEPPEG